MKTSRLLMRIDPELEAEVLADMAKTGESKSAWVGEAIRLRLAAGAAKQSSPTEGSGDEESRAS